MTKKTTTLKRRERKTGATTSDDCSPADLARTTKEFDHEFVADTFAPMTPSQRRRWNRSKKPGRPRKPEGEKSVRVLITMDPALLLVLDRTARKMNIGRSTLIARTLEAMLTHARLPRIRRIPTRVNVS